MSQLLLPLSTVALFFGAFLAFSQQPMVARMILPQLGGVPAVWNSCLVFYQAVLLGGYAYAHLIGTRLRLRNQLIVHALVLLAPLLVLPISLQGRAQPPGGANPIPWLMGMLFISVALPFFAVTTTAPLLQRWFSASDHAQARDPYFLYAASNLGSLLALLSYPLIAERYFSLPDQSRLWSLGYGVAVLLILGCGAIALMSRRGAVFSKGPGLPTGDPESSAESAPRADTGRPLRWVFYAFLPSSLLLGVTQYISTDIAVVPLLWVIPLSIYLLSFILVFARRPPLSHAMVLRIFPGALVALVLLLLIRAAQPVAIVFPVHLITFFLAAMVCHGELVRLRPPARDLTRFYLWIATGGVLGGLFNALVAPLVFTGVAEYPLVLFLTALALPYRRESDRRANWSKDVLLVGILIALIVVIPLALRWLGIADDTGAARTPLYAIAVVLCYLGSRNRRRFGFAVGGLLLAGLVLPGTFVGRTVFARRTFFGVNRVLQFEQEEEAYHALTHGTTRHGLQSLDPERQSVPLLYYHPNGPSGDIFRMLNEDSPQARVGAIGLGSGALSAYANAGQVWTFYEIDPVVAEIATTREYFTYLHDTEAEWEVVLGDGRLSIAGADRGQFDLIVVDAYGSDAIPVHMLTREAVELFADKLAPDGLIAFHISNRFLDLEPVLGGIAESLGYEALVRDDNAITPGEQARGRVASIWVAVARRPRTLEPLRRLRTWRALRLRPGARVWTDSFTNLLGIIRWE